MANECCELCKRRYAIVYRVPDDLWAQIAPRKDTLGPYPEHQGGGLLCPDCATVEAERIGVVLHFDARSDWSTDHSDLRAEIERLSDLLATTQRELAEANERWDHFQKLASDHRDELERELAEARAEAERWAAQALKEEECRIAWQAERDRLAARLSEYNRWPDPLQSPQAEAIRNGKIDMTEIVSLFDKMERELEQLRFVAADNARLEAENDNGGDLTRCEFCGRPILGRIVMDVNFTPSCEECAGAAAIQGGRHE